MSRITYRPRLLVRGKNPHIGRIATEIKLTFCVYTRATFRSPSVRGVQLATELKARCFLSTDVFDNRMSVFGISLYVVSEMERIRNENHDGRQRCRYKK